MNNFLLKAFKLFYLHLFLGARARAREMLQPGERTTRLEESDRATQSRLKTTDGRGYCAEE